MSKIGPSNVYWGDSPWRRRDQSSGAWGSCVHPHRPFSKSHKLSDWGEAATVEQRGMRNHCHNGWAKHQKLSSLLLQLPNENFTKWFLALPVVVMGTVVISMSGSRVGVTVVAGVLISTKAHITKSRSTVVSWSNLQTWNRDYFCGISPLVGYTEERI